MEWNESLLDYVEFCLFLNLEIVHSLSIKNKNRRLEVTAIKKGVNPGQIRRVGQRDIVGQNILNNKDAFFWWFSPFNHWQTEHTL